MNKISNYNRTNPINKLQDHLFNKLSIVSTDYEIKKMSIEPDYSEFQEETHVQKRQLLSKAKQLTYSNRGKIERIKKQLKKIQENEGDFMTGIGVYTKQQTQQTEKTYECEPNQDQMLKDVIKGSYDDLSELRKMIKQTEKNLKSYSHSVYNIQNEVIQAADKYKQDIGIGLSMKINKCNLGKTFYKQPKLHFQTLQPQTAGLKNRSSSSYNSKRKIF